MKRNTSLIKQVFLTLFLIITSFGFSQQLDSLKLKYENTKTSENKVGALLEIGDYYTSQNLDSALLYNKKALKVATDANIDTLIASSASSIATDYLMKGRLDLSMDYFLKALKIYENTNHDTKAIKIRHNIGIIFMHQKKHDEALLNFNKTLDALERESLPLSSENEANKGKILNNIGIIYDVEGDLNKALEFYSRGLTHSKAAEDLKTLSSLYSNMGLVYLKMDKFDLSESYLNEALEIRIAENDAFGQCKSYQHLGKLYKERGQLKLAEETLLLGLSKCEEANVSEPQAQVIEILSQTYALSGDYQKAYEQHLAFTSINDSLSNSETQRKITEAEMQFKFDKETQAKEAKQQKKQYVTIFIGIVLILGILIIITLYSLLKTKSKNQQLAKDKVDLENIELSLRKQSLENELETRSKDLTTNVMYLIKKNELISEISLRLITVKKSAKKENQKDIQKIIIDLQTGKDDAIWDEFEVRFNQVYNDFYERLNDQFPNLTINERKVCAFLKLNMTSKEICTLTRQSTNSLNVARTRLRKKLGLNNTDTNLTSFLENI
ncbi:tetratricopeptide repeat protein [Formosa sp. PL04]|uniref:tetratricopeptide repeat protein n=1 Tax=Formosa sp. PL04 TaxID=3081755 RepID=UPI0029814DFC|nr:tetratricopeptide repeat protein [Formosa sp. PL04]MDW5289762.1 tetratricopeptide repeat protein [Formosa sp. PL04]